MEARHHTLTILVTCWIHEAEKKRLKVAGDLHSGYGVEEDGSHRRHQRQKRHECIHLHTTCTLGLLINCANNSSLSCRILFPYCPGALLTCEIYKPHNPGPKTQTTWMCKTECNRLKLAVIIQNGFRENSTSHLFRFHRLIMFQQGWLNQQLKSCP